MAMINEGHLKFQSQISPDSYLFHADASLGPKIIKKFKQGHYLIEDSLDLHGYTLSQSEDILNDFIQNSLKNGLRCVLLIHGKGSKAILKNYARDFLQAHAQVLAFCSAKPKEGGTGALYILLKKQHSTGGHYEEE